MEKWSVCLKSKSKQSPRPRQSEESRSSTNILDLVHTDLQRPMKFMSRSGAKYFIPLLDDASGLSLVRYICSKTETEKALNEMTNELEKFAGKRVKSLRSDSETELLSNDFRDWLKWNQIVHEKSAAHSPKSNGKTERPQKAL